MNHFDKIQQKIVSKNILLEQVNHWKEESKKVVFTNGCFDILHRGHITYLSQAADYGDKLIVAINADSSVKKLNKGVSRPLQDEKSRALIVAALKFVDAVIVFNENTPFNLISNIKPDVLIKGGDYDVNVLDKSSKKYIVGSDIVHQYNGMVKVIPFVKGYSTSIIEQKIKNEKS